MSYDPEYLAADYIGYVRQLQAHAGNEAHALRLARALDIRVRVGLVNRALPEHADGPRVVVQPWYYGDSDLLRHETAHVMLWWSGLEREVIEHFGDEVGWQVVERLCRDAVTFLRHPQPMVDGVVGRWGVTARAAAELGRVSGAGPVEALRRIIYDDPQAPRAGFLAVGVYIRDVAECGLRLPLTRLERVPEPALRLPTASFCSLPQRGLLGMVAG